MAILTLSKQRIIWATIFSFIIVSTLTLVAYNYKEQLDIQSNKDNEAQLKVIKHYIHQTERIKLPIGDEWSFYDAKMKTYSINDILANGSIFCVFIDKSQCEVCWKRALNFLEENTRNTSLHPIIIFSGFLHKDYLLLSKKVQFPCYFVEATVSMDNFFRTSEPTFFVLNQAKFIYYIFYPDGMYDTMGINYLSAVASCIKNTKSEPSKTPVIAQNQQIEFKDAPLRKKQFVRLYLQNLGNKSIGIQKVMPSCDCMLIEHYPNAIDANSKATIDVSFVPDKKGWMQRTITIMLDNKQTIEFYIDIYVA